MMTRHDICCRSYMADTESSLLDFFFFFFFFFFVRTSQSLVDVTDLSFIYCIRTAVY